jgi:hypothetical protein
MSGLSFEVDPKNSAQPQASSSNLINSADVADVVRRFIDIYSTIIYDTHILCFLEAICFQTPIILQLLVGNTAVDKFPFITHQVRVSTFYNLSWRQVKFTKRIHRIWPGYRSRAARGMS